MERLMSPQTIGIIMLLVGIVVATSGLLIQTKEASAKKLFEASVTDAVIDDDESDYNKAVLDLSNSATWTWVAIISGVLAIIYGGFLALFGGNKKK